MGFAHGTAFLRAFKQRACLAASGRLSVATYYPLPFTQPKPFHFAAHRTHFYKLPGYLLGDRANL